VNAIFAPMYYEVLIYVNAQNKGELYKV